jgi:hypothetical protein
MQLRAIPSTAERLPVIGCGTWQTFDVGSSAAQRVPLTAVLRNAVAFVNECKVGCGLRWPLVSSPVE